MKREFKIFLFLSIMILACIYPSTKVKAETCGDYEYKLSSGTATIKGYTGTEKEVTIPEELDGYTVTKLDNYSFGYTEITSVTIPNTITEINSYAFSNSTVNSIYTGICRKDWRLCVF